ncbi:MAG: mercuric transporter MerT family protein [Alphaproteobacteria bacterium]
MFRTDLARVGQPVHDATERGGRGATPSALAALAGLAGAVAMVACCIAPLALFLLGVSGPWIATLTGLGAYKTWIAAGTVGSLGLGLTLAYRPPRACEPGSACATGKPRRLVRGVLWVGMGLALASIGFTLGSPFLLGA